MGKAKFLLGRIKNMHYKQFFQTIEKMHKKSGKSRVYLFADTVMTGIKYQAGYVDYLNAEMWNMNAAQKSDVITRGINNEYVIKYNDFDYTHYFLNKADFNKMFDKYLRREWIEIDTEADKDKFNSFIEGKEAVIVKPLNEMGGTGVTKVKAVPESFEQVQTMLPVLVEELIEQEESLAELNPSSVNSIRVVSFLKKDGTPVILAAYLRVGQGGVVDNFCSGGMLTAIDLETGVVFGPGVDIDNNVFYNHPLTGKPLVGFQVPQFEEIKAMVLEAALMVPQVRYVGWDVSVSKKGPCFIEGNEYPGHVFFNFPQHHPDGKGQRSKFEAIMD